jgi:8-oxo-dGTP diphosphatase
MRVKVEVKHVATVIPCYGSRALLQLRDEMPNIDFPGCWGLFGGEINPGEEPAAAAKRELYEEIGFRPAAVQLLGKDIVEDLGGIVIYTYYCQLDSPLSRLLLDEGMDLGLFTMAEIKGEKLYSAEMGRMYPVVPVPYVLEMIQQALITNEAVSE